MTHHTRRSNRPTTRAQRDARRAVAVLATGAALIGVISLAQSVFKDSPAQVTAAGPNTQPLVDASSTTIAGSQPAVAVDASSTTIAAAQLAGASGQDVAGDEPWVSLR